MVRSDRHAAARFVISRYSGLRRLVAQTLLAALLGVGALSSMPAMAALDAHVVQPLGADDFDAKADAISQLIVEGSPDALALLTALQSGNVLATDSGQVVVQQGDDYLDAATGKKLDPQAPALQSAQAITLNNLLRARIDAGIAALQLSSPDLTVRRAATAALLKTPPQPSLKTPVARARDKETDPTLKKQLDTLWAMTAMHDPDAATRLEAVELVAARRNLEMTELFVPFVTKNADGSYAEPDPAVRAAAQKGLDELVSIRRASDIAGTLFAGLSLGSVLLLAALGLAITYGVIGVINMAHGEFLMVGAYATYVVENLFGHYAPGAIAWYPLVAVPVSFAVAALCGIALERLVLRFLYGRPLETLLTTFGISLLMMQAVRTIFGAQNVQVSNPSWMSGGFEIIPNLILPYNRLVILAFSVAVVAIAWAVLNRTRLGLFVRAVTQNRRMAACVGVRTAHVDTYAFAFGAGIAGLGGCALSQIGNVGPDLGQTYIIDSFMAVVL
ncbi:MAG: urea ABC transporter permease subunit UrtB, partial [Janthinobacterium lividum]